MALAGVVEAVREIEHERDGDDGDEIIRCS
jgi:hypothetical protein